MSDRERTAIHEAAHAAMAFTVKRSIEVISIAPARHYAGVTIPRTPTIPGGEPNLFLPAPMQPWRFRRWIESTVMISQAGPAADCLLRDSPRPPGFLAPDPDEEYALSLARMAAPSPVEARSLADADKPGPRDEETAMSLAHGIAGDTAVHYVAWLGQETNRIVVGSRFVRLVDALVPHLLKHTTISGRLARRVMVATDEEYSHGS